MINLINFSGGRSSAYMTKRLLDQGIENTIISFQNTGKEMPQTLDFINECDKRWNLNIVWLEYRYGNNFEVVNYENASRDGRPFKELIEYKKHFLPNTLIRYCTDQLKIQTVRRYLHSIGIKEWTSQVGIRFDEPRRWAKLRNSPNYIDVEMPLVKMMIVKENVLSFWKDQDFDLKLNEPYGNCDCCFLKGKGKLSIIAKEKPELFDWWIGQEDKKGNTFKKEIRYKQILEKSHSQIGLWDGDPSFECFCNID